MSNLINKFQRWRKTLLKTLIIKLLLLFGCHQWYPINSTQINSFMKISCRLMNLLMKNCWLRKIYHKVGMEQLVMPKILDNLVLMIFIVIQLKSFRIKWPLIFKILKISKISRKILANKANHQNLEVDKTIQIYLELRILLKLEKDKLCKQINKNRQVVWSKLFQDKVRVYKIIRYRNQLSKIIK